MALAAIAPLASDLPALAQSFRRMLRARNRSPRTVEGYLSGVETFIAFLARKRLPMSAAEVRRADIEAFVAEQVEQHKPNTAATRYRAVQQFMRWLSEEGEIARNPMCGMRPPMVPEAILATRTAAPGTALEWPSVIPPTLHDGVGARWCRAADPRLSGRLNAGVFT